MLALGEESFEDELRRIVSSYFSSIFSNRSSKFALNSYRFVILIVNFLFRELVPCILRPLKF